MNLLKKIRNKLRQGLDTIRGLEDSGRAKPFILKAGLTKSREPYKYGGK